ncbi:MAG: hypothetical protein V7K68_16540 [Nostoc sp.]
MQPFNPIEQWFDESGVVYRTSLGDALASLLPRRVRQGSVTTVGIAII